MDSSSDLAQTPKRFFGAASMRAAVFEGCGRAKQGMSSTCFSRGCLKDRVSIPDTRILEGHARTC